MHKNKVRCIHIFPRVKEENIIDEIREKYDNLFNCIEPHITLVFPFESNIDTEKIIEEIKQVLKNQEPFKINLKGLKMVEDYGYFLFVDINKGKEEIKKIHYNLYKGLLNPYQSEWTKNENYSPHITVGRFQTKEELITAYNRLKNIEFEYKVMVDRLYIERIGEKEESIIEYIFKF